MHGWTDIEVSRLRRRDLLREAERVRLVKETGSHGTQRRSLASEIRWELARGLGLAGKLLRRPYPRD